MGGAARGGGGRRARAARGGSNALEKALAHTHASHASHASHAPHPPLPLVSQFLQHYAPPDCPEQERWSPLNSGTESVWALWLWSLAAWALVLAPAAWALVEGGAAAWQLGSAAPAT